MLWWVGEPLTYGGDGRDSLSGDLLQPDTSMNVMPLPDPAAVLGFAPAYPNPFDQTTTLRYSLPQPMRVRLVVYDLLGREVAVLIDEQQANGIQTVDFEAGGLPAGVYLARLRLDHLIFTKTLVVAR